MNDRKAWELTDEELISLGSAAPQYDRPFATAAARKALEWAAQKCAALKRYPLLTQEEQEACAGDLAHNFACDVCADQIRKELPDG